MLLVWHGASRVQTIREIAQQDWVRHLVAHSRATGSAREPIRHEILLLLKRASSIRPTLRGDRVTLVCNRNAITDANAVSHSLSSNRSPLGASSLCEEPLGEGEAMKCCQRENPELLSVSQMIQQNLGRSTIPRAGYGQSIPIRLGCTSTHQ